MLACSRCSRVRSLRSSATPERLPVAFVGQLCVADPRRKRQLPGLHGETRSMDEGLRAQMESYLSRLDGLIRRGGQIRDVLATHPFDGSAIAAIRMWQEDCGV